VAGRLDTEPGGVTDAFQVLVDNIPAMVEVMKKQSDDIAKMLDLQERYQVTGPGGGGEAAGHIALAQQYQPRMREDLLRQLTRQGAIPADATMGITKMTGMGATTSLQNLQAYAAQRLGQLIGRRFGPDPDWKLYPEHEDLVREAEAQRQQHGGAQPGGSQATPGGDLRPPAQAIMDRWAPAGPGGGGAMILTPEGQQARDQKTTLRLLQETAAATQSTARSAEGTEEELAAGGRLSATAQAAAGAAGARMTPEREHVPLPADLVGQTTPAPPGAAPSPSGGPQAGGGAPGGPGPGGPGGGAGTGGPPGAGGGVTPQQRASWAQQFGARVAMTGGTPRGIAEMLRKIPGVGLVEDIAGAYQAQREAGRAYQEVEGGTNLGAQTERAHRTAYEISMFGRVPEGVAADMFNQVTALGFSQRAVGQGQQAQNRQSALNFLYHQYNATGMDIEQGAQILATATQNATVSLSTVSDAISSLSDVAGKAGVNAEEARNNFNAYFNTVLQGTGAGPQAATAAGAIAAQQAGMGQAFAGANFAGEASTRMMYMVSGMAGISPNRAQYLQRTNIAEYNRLVTGVQGQFLQNLPGLQAHLAALRQMIQAAGGGAQVKAQPAIAAQIAQQFLDQFQAQDPNLNMDVWAQVVTATMGVQGINAGNVMQWVVDQVAGQTLAAATPGGGTPGGAPGGGGGAVSAGGAAAAVRAGTAASGQYGLATGTPTVPGTGAAGARVGPQQVGQTWQQQLLGGAIPNVAKTYLGMEQKTGKRSPVLEAILQNAKPGTSVAVRTASGTRVMDINDAIRYYPAEVEAGQVEFYNAAGQNVGASTLTGGHTDPAAAAAAAAEASQKGPGAQAGVTISQWQKKTGRTGTAQGGDATQGVTVDLTPEAAQLLKILPTNADQAAASSTAPSYPYYTTPSRLRVS